MKNRIKTFISNAKDACVDWWIDYGDIVLIVLMTGTAVAGVAATNYWKGKYEGVIENRKN